MPRALELEDGGEQLRPEAAPLQLRADEVHRRDQVLEVRILDDEPLVAEIVRLAPQLRARLPRGDVEQLLQIVLGAHEVTGRQRLEDDRSAPGRPQPELVLERDDGGREREQLLAPRLLELAPPEDDVQEPDRPVP
jgi:hypothetical protein